MLILIVLRQIKKYRIRFKQSILNLSYLLEVFNKISHYCSSIPRYETTKLIYNNHNTKVFGRLIIETRAYPIFNILNKYWTYISHIYKNIFFFNKNMV